MGGMSIAQMRPTPSQQWVGVITEVDGGGIRVAAVNQMSDPRGTWIDVTDNTRVDGDRRGLRPNAQVRVVYVRTAGGAVARRVTILPNESPRPLRKTDKDLRQ